MRSLRVLVVMVLLAVIVPGVGAAYAADSVRLEPGVPFLWIRNAPASNAGVVYTVYPSSYATMQLTGNTHWDGYQTWAEVYLLANSGIRGWVEQGSVESASATTAPSYSSGGGYYWYPAQVFDPWYGYYGGWQHQGGGGVYVPSYLGQAPTNLGQNAALRFGVPFLYIRSTPGGSAVYTLLPGQVFQLTGAVIFDGYQSWSQVRYYAFGGMVQGWVEQGSIQ